MHQIKYLCEQVPDNEWSGILMYKLVGNFTTGNFHCVVKDIFLMDIGSSVYTEYEFNERYIKHRMDNPDLTDYESGHCHSHNHMGCFFSGTDMQELQDNAPNYNYYLSLIVNNEFVPKAKIAFVGEQEKKESVVRSFFGDNGKLYNFKSNVTKKENVLFTYDCQIEYESIAKVDRTFEDRLIEVIEIKQKEAEEKKKLAAEKAKTNINSSTKYAKPNLKVYTGYSDVDDFNGYDEFTAYEEDPNLIEELLADSLMCTYNCQKTIEEALFQANIDYKEKGDEFITDCGNWFRGLGPYMLGKDELDEKDMTEIIDALQEFGEDTFPKLTEKLVMEFLK